MHISSGPDRRRSGRARRADERWRSKPVQSQRRFASRVIRSHRPTSSVPPCRGISCGRACRRPTEGTLRCRGTSTVRMPLRDTDPNRTDSLDSDHRRSGLRTSETLGGEGTRSVERIRCAQNSSSMSPLYRSPPRMLSTPFEFQIVLTPKPVHHTDSTTLVLSLQKFPRTTVGRDYLTNFAVALVVL